MKLWQKNTKLNKKIEEFTVGNDYLLDSKLLKYDCIASIAHAEMLNKIGILTTPETDCLIKGLNKIIDSGLKISKEDEDCHTAIENYLIKECGDAGKKIHTARSRNDQVLTALRLYEKEELNKIKSLLAKYGKTLNKLIAKYGSIKIPGYTHMQKAMPTDVNTWIGCFVESNKDNILLLESVEKMIDQSPLGSAAGFGVPVIEIDKKMTSDAMGFSKVMENSIYAQMSRGKFESTILHLLSQIMFDLNKLATDLMLFSMKEFKFVSLPDEFCTGSSIMPQKKNYDVLELVRGKYHILLGEEIKVKSLISNLMSGYKRDMQLMKGPLFNSIDIAKECLEIMSLVLANMKFNKENCEKAITEEMYATEKAYELVKKGVPFREAYKKVKRKLLIQEGTTNET